MKLSPAPLVCCLALGFAGCAHTGKPKAATDPGYHPHITVPAGSVGSAPSGYAEAIIKTLQQTSQFNALSDYRFEEPRPAVVQDVGLPGKRQNHYGWVVKVTATPRQLPHDYIGPRYHYFMFAEGHAADITQAFAAGMAAYVLTEASR